MAPTPITATHRLTVFYTVVSKSHRIHFYVDAYPSILLSSGWGITTFSTTTLDAQDCANSVADRLKEYLAADSSVDSWLLEEYSSGAYVFKASGTLGVAGTSTSTGQRAGTQWTLVCKDTENKFLKLVILEGVLDLFDRYTTVAAVPSNQDAVSDSMMSTSALEMGDWVRSRHNNQRDRFIAVVTALNRRVRRSRGIA